MKTLLPDGPGSVLESLHSKFMVSLLSGIDNPRHFALAPQQHRFRERLMQDILSQNPLRSWELARSFSDRPAIRLGLTEKLANLFEPGHFALTEMSRYLQILTTKSNGSPELRQLYGSLGEQFRQRAEHKKRALIQQGLEAQARLHHEQIFARWQAGNYDGWSLAGRCFVALEELRWGPFGDAWRLANPELRAMLREKLRSMAAHCLADGIGTARETRHFYHQWLTTSGLMDYQEMLCWMGNDYDAWRQPVCWSVTQIWQPVALGMPRLCSALRLVDAMIEELFDVARGEAAFWPDSGSVSGQRS